MVDLFVAGKQAGAMRPDMKTRHDKHCLHRFIALFVGGDGPLALRRLHLSAAYLDMGHGEANRDPNPIFNLFFLRDNHEH